MGSICDSTGSVFNLNILCCKPNDQAGKLSNFPSSCYGLKFFKLKISIFLSYSYVMKSWAGITVLKTLPVQFKYYIDYLTLTFIILWVVQTAISFVTTQRFFK